MNNLRLFLLTEAGVDIVVWVMFFYLFFLFEPFFEFCLFDVESEETLILLILTHICLHNYYINAK